MVILLPETNHDTNTEIETLKEQLKKEQAKAKEHSKEIQVLKDRLKELSGIEERYKYKLAEIDNYRKQMERESQIHVKVKIEEFLKKLINLRDDYLRAIETAKKSNGSAVIINGLESILKNFDIILKEEGIREIDAVGKIFDPSIHEAVSFVDTNEYPENIITTEIRKGYMLSDRVIRPSLVEVSKKANDKSEEG